MICTSPLSFRLPPETPEQLPFKPPQNEPPPLLPEKKIRRFLPQSNLLPLQMHHHLRLPLPHHQTLLLPLEEALRCNHYSFPQLFLRPSLQGVTRPFHHVQNPIRDIQDQTNRPRNPPPPPKRYK